jgi:hypothetical protein
MKNAMVLTGIACLMFINASAAIAADQDQLRTQDRTQTQDRIEQQTQDQTQVRTQDRERIYGSQLMTREERTEYHAQMRKMKTPQEREAFRIEHHKRMQERARERGLDMPDTPPAKAGGMGPGVGGRGGR